MTKHRALILMACLACGTSGVLNAEIDEVIEYRPGPAIANAAIKKQYDCQWFHISQSCVLKAKGSDRDDESIDGGPWVDAGLNFIDLEHTTWTGQGLLQTVGEAVTWHLDVPTGDGGTTITATIKDKPTTPDATADDPDAIATKVMSSYQVVAYLNGTGNAGSPTKTVVEIGGSADAVLLSLAHDPITTNGFGPTVVSDGTSRYGAATWSLDTLPSSANLGTGGQLTTSIGATAGGTFEGTVWDNDMIDGDVSITVGLSGGTGVSASVSTDITISSDSVESDVAAGFAFSSDDLGEDKSDKFEFKSSELPDNPFTDNTTKRQQPYGYSNDVTIRKLKGNETKAKAIIKTQVSSYAPSAILPRNCTEGIVQTYGWVTYRVGVPTYEQGTAPMPPPEPGY